MRPVNRPKRNPYYNGPVSDHFDGLRFFHPGLPTADKTLFDVLKWRLLNRHATPWPPIAPAPLLRPPQRVDRLQISHVGHASYLIQTSGRNILVDPVWSDRASPFKWAGPRRHNPPAIRFEDLPPIDTVLISHNHYDHMDTATLQKLWAVHRPRIVTPLGSDAVLRSAASQIEAEAGDWWQEFALAEQIRLTIVPSYHWSSRSLRDRRAALWGGFVLETPAGVIYCAGDTAYRDGAIFPQIGKRFGPPTVAMLPIGAYSPRWFMHPQHANPDEAVQIALDCGAKHVLGVHWGTFRLTDEPYDEPPRLLATAVRERGLDPARFIAFTPGDTWTAPNA